MGENGNNLVRLDFTKSSFMANGREYLIEKDFSIERYVEYQILEKEIGFGTSFRKLFEGLKNAREHLNNTHLVDAAVQIDNLMRGVAKVEEREPLVLKMCALFMNRAEENRHVITEDMITQKIEDWKAEGIAMTDFFTAALNSMDGYIEASKAITQIISQTWMV